MANGFANWDLIARTNAAANHFTASTSLDKERRRCRYPKCVPVLLAGILGSGEDCGDDCWRAELIFDIFCIPMGFHKESH